MFKRLVEAWYRHKTMKLSRIPLYTIYFDYYEYKQGVKKNCHCYCHPDMKNDAQLSFMLKEAVDYIRENYDMDNFAKVFK